MASILSEFKKNFGIEDNLAEEKENFVQRINQTVFKKIQDSFYPYKGVFVFLCYQLGVNADDRISSVNRLNYGSSSTIPGIRSLTNDNFTETLKLLVLLYKFFEDQEEWKKYINNFTLLALSSAGYDLEIRWNEGMFYPSGAEALDEKLIDDILGVLQENNRKSIFIAYKKGIKEFLESRKDKSKLKNVVRDMQLALDETSKVLLVDKNVGFKHLLKDKNWDEIVKNKFYQKIFIQLNEFADKLAKHKAEAAFNEHEVETFVYLTGIFIRLVFIQQ